jgi:hypothetical protein
LRRATTAHSRLIGLALAILAALAAAPYVWTPTLPFISDDYIQIGLAREFVSSEGWRSLAADPLYRCRATSLVLTRLTEICFGLSQAPYFVSAILLHALNTWLVLAFGVWRAVGFRAAALAAAFFAVYEGHQEAVVWYAALPELLVFFFSGAAFLAWVLWLERGGRAWLGAAAVSFALALASKESAAALPALLLLPVWAGSGKRPWRLPWACFCLSVLVYAGLIWRGNGTHQHFQDGTFSIGAPFVMNALRSAARMLWFWGGLAAIVVLLRRRAGFLPVAALGLAWMLIALLPYSFLLYMDRVPSRHTYLASAGLALVAAAAALTMEKMRWRRGLAICAVLVLVHNTAYVWTRKRGQFIERAVPTERLIDFAARERTPIYVECFPYARMVAEYTLRVRLGLPLVSKPEPGSRQFCYQRSSLVP